MTIYFRQPRGFTLFFAMLIASLAIAIGVAIYDLTVRELDLSATASQSQYAIYAADTGAECAIYWDLKYPGLGSTAFATSSTSRPPQSGVTCNGTDIAAAGVGAGTWPIPGGTPTAATSSFVLSIPSGNGQTYCAVVTVAKVGNPALTRIISQGYNTCTEGGVRLERSLQVNY
ncbi:MAG: hypothetical protein KGI70_02290 [Patescibacteria group bacterium]|nr:hypothetical protein [Patescibacteria group bacterium]